MLRCQTGDSESFVELYRDFAPRTRRFLQGMIGTTDAEDAQQELWIAVFQSIGSLSHPASFTTWLFRLARFKAIDKLRKASSQHEVSLLDVNEEAVATDVFEREVGDDIDVNRALAKLSPPHKQTVLLRYWEGLSYAQIALVTDCPLGTVRSRLHHAHRIMRGTLLHPLEEFNEI